MPTRITKFPHAPSASLHALLFSYLKMQSTTCSCDRAGREGGEQPRMDERHGKSAGLPCCTSCLESLQLMAKGKLDDSGESRCGRERVITDVSKDLLSPFSGLSSLSSWNMSVRPYVTSHALAQIKQCSAHPIVTIHRLHKCNPSNHNYNP